MYVRVRAIPLPPSEFVGVGILIPPEPFCVISSSEQDALDLDDDDDEDDEDEEEDEEALSGEVDGHEEEDGDSLIG